MASALIRRLNRGDFTDYLVGENIQIRFRIVSGATNSWPSSIPYYWAALVLQRYCDCAGEPEAGGQAISFDLTTRNSRRDMAWRGDMSGEVLSQVGLTDHVVGGKVKKCQKSRAALSTHSRLSLPTIGPDSHSRETGKAPKDLRLANSQPGGEGPRVPVLDFLENRGLECPQPTHFSQQR